MSLYASIVIQRQTFMDMLLIHVFFKLLILTRCFIRVLEFAL